MRQHAGHHGERPLPVADLDAVLDRTADQWRALDGARLLVTGGSGFFGRWILESLLHARRRMGVDVRAIATTRDARGFTERLPFLATDPAIQLLPCDVVTTLPEFGMVTHVLHAAADTGRPRSALDQFDGIVLGTRHVLQAARRARAGRILLTSSGAVYGPPTADTGRMAESLASAPDPTDPRAAYGHAKRAAETLCVLHGAEGGAAAVIARCFAFIGPGLRLDGPYAAGNFLADALAGRPVRLLGDGRAARTYMHPVDLTIWLITLLVRGVPGRAYNVGSEEEVTVAELAARIAALADPPVGAVFAARDGAAAAPAGTGLRDRYVPDTTRVRDELGLSVSVPLSESLERTWRWHRAGTG